MWNAKKSVKLSLILVNIFLLLLIVGIIALPTLVTWYVEYKGREASLPTTIMLTCYPCVPFAAVALWYLRKVLINVKKEMPFCKSNAVYLGRISFCAFAITAIMLFSGRYYLPFYVCAICAAFIGLLIRIFKNVIESASSSVGEETEKE